MSDILWTNVTVRLGEIDPWQFNPRQSDKRARAELLSTLDEFGQPVPFILGPCADGRYPLYDGHQRYGTWMQKFGAAFEVDARVSSRPLSDDERRKYVIKFHASAVGGWNEDALSSWDADLIASWGVSSELVRGWEHDVKTFKELLQSEQAGGADADDGIEPTDRFEEVAAKWGTAPNQLWQAGDHFIYCGDSLLSESVEIVLQGQLPALIEADPPYGVSIVASNGYVGGGESTKGMIPFGGVKNRRGTVGASIPFGSKSERGSVGAAHVVEVGKYPVIIGDEDTETAKKAITLYLESFPDAYQVWWGANYYVEAVKPSPCWLVWNKETTGNFADCELAWVNAEMSAKLFTHRWNGMLRDSEREKRWHPTQKPSALAEWSYGLFTEPGDVVVDPFGGAGWTLLAAERSGRKACVIEKSHEYTAVQLERMSVAFPHLPIVRLDAGG
jgi:hypothetical protein